MARVGYAGLLVTVIMAFAGSPTVVAQPSVVGAWGHLHDLWDYGGGVDCCVTCTPYEPGPCNEIAHVTILPKGPKTGFIHYWRANGSRPLRTYLWQVDSDRIDTMVVTTPSCTYLVEQCGSSCPTAACGNVFCSGHVQLPDGRTLTAGANVYGVCPVIPPDGEIFGSYESWIFDPSNLDDPPPSGGWPAWSFGGSTRENRWYPSLLVLDNGDVLLAGGLIERCGNPAVTVRSPRFEIKPWNGGALGPWEYAQDPTSGPLTLTNPQDLFGTYPHLQLLPAPAVIPGTPGPPSSDIVAVDMEFWGWPGNTYSYLLSRSDQDHIFPLASAPLVPLAGSGPPPILRAQRELNSVRDPFNPTRFRIVGGRAEIYPTDPGDYSGRTETHRIDVNLANGPASTWAQDQTGLTLGRVYSQTVILPDKSLLVIGGSDQDYQEDDSLAVNPRLIPERGTFNAATGTWTWTQMAAMGTHRLYHSGGILLPDGRVLSMGGDNYPFYSGNDFQALTYLADAQVYRPPYLFMGPRPRLWAGPEIVYGTPFSLTVDIPPGASLGSLVLIRPGSATHGLDFEQRLVDLSYTVLEVSTDVTTGWFTYEISCNAPQDGRQAPPGYWMLFAVTEAGVPSVAPFVKVRP